MIKMKYSLGFIGGGNMAKAMIQAIISNGVLKAQDIIVSNIDIADLQKTKKELGIHITLDNSEIAKYCEKIVLSVKPHQYADVIPEIVPFVNEKSLIITVAAGKSILSVQKLFGKEVKIIRTMPNTPALIQEGITAICRNEQVKDIEMGAVLKIFSSFGKVEIIEERLMDAVVSVSGSAPAYIYVLIEAMADAAVLNGLPRDKAYLFAAQTVLGSAKMVLQTGMHPAQLKDMVCSPGGTTIEALRILEQRGFRSAVIEAMDTCVQKAKNLS
ncbi:pyrroline-5-carboxylate reductase [Holotrichia oblita]|nr:pyrroline-5-carboxylate reductase [Holotrichia oblita]